MTKGLLRFGLATVTVVAAFSAAGASAQQAQFVGPQTSSRQAADRTAEDRQQKGRETEPPKPAESAKPSDSGKSESKASVQRQPEPQRQAEPQRQREPQRQHDSPRQDSQRPDFNRRDDASDHWKDPGPAWRSLGPAWSNQNNRPGAQRPGQDVFRAAPGTYDARDRNRRDDSRGNRRGRDVYYYVPYGVPVPVPYDYAPYYPSALPPAPEPEPAARASDDRPLGFLQLRVQPRTAEVFVDGAFAGTVDDFGGRSARQLAAGPRRIEIVAPGYQTLTIDVRVPENDTVTFTRDLEPLDTIAEPQRPVVEIPHKTMYIVPRCFVGDRMPEASDLPAGCDIKDLRIIP